MVHTHLHTVYSILDSTTQPIDFIKKAAECGMKAIAFTEHGNVFNSIKKKQLCEEYGLKMLYGVECYLTRTLEEKIKDNYHTILIAKNQSGIEEINRLMSDASFPDDNHFYYRPRISFEEFINISNNVITTSACLGGPLANLPEDDEWYEKLIDRYDFLEIQPHISPKQIEYNRHLYHLAGKYNKPLISASDVHEIDSYKAECRLMWLHKDGTAYEDEDYYDLTFHDYEETLEMYRKQNALDMDTVIEALANTDRLADMCEDYKLDYSLKYTHLYDNPFEMLRSETYDSYNDKVKSGAIDVKDEDKYFERIEEELEVFRKVGMESFILFFSEQSRWERDNDIITGFGRGSVCGSLVAYLLDIIDVNPIIWGTVFSRFVNEQRVSIGDIDKDYVPSDRQKVFKHIAERLGEEYTANIGTFSTLNTSGIIDVVGQALNLERKEIVDIKTGYKEIDKKIAMLERAKDSDKISYEDYETKKAELDKEMEDYLSRFDKVFYYYKGLKGAIKAIGHHASGFLGSPIKLKDSIGLRYNKDINGWVSQCDMKNVDSVNYVKYDILGLKTVQVLKDTFTKYPKAHEVDWNDENVYKDMLTSPVGLFQMESESTFNYLCTFKPQSVQDIVLVNAVIRPSCASFRDDIFARKQNKCPSDVIAEVLKDSYGYMVYQEQQIAFLQKACGFTGSEADSVRRSVSKGIPAIMDKWLPEIERRYIERSDKPEDIAQNEISEFLTVFVSSLSYCFGYNHAVAYSMLTYLTAYARYYYPKEFIAAYLNNATNDDDIINGTILAEQKGIKIFNPIYGKSRGAYSVHPDGIYKGVKSILNVSEAVGEDLYQLASQKASMSFLELLDAIEELPSTNKKNIGTLIKVDFFREYGKARKLSKIYELYKELKGKKQMNKDNCPAGIKQVIIRNLKRNEEGFSCTAKLYKFDWRKLLEQIWKALPDADFSILERIINELSYLNYLQSDDLKKYKIGNVKFQSKYGSWCVNVDGKDIWYDNKSETTLNKGDMILIYNDTIYTNKYGRSKNILVECSVIELDRK